MIRTLAFTDAISQAGQVDPGYPDEPWALDNVTLTAGPLPATVALLGGGAALLTAASRRCRRQHRS